MPGGSWFRFAERSDAPQAIAPEDAIVFRRMRGRDVDRVHKVELLSYAWPWTKGAFRDCLQPGYEVWLAHSDESLIGYLVLFTGAGESHLLNLCVHPDHRRQRLGRRLLVQAVERATRLRSSVLYLEVRASNRAAQRLYRQHGFNQIGRRGNYYPARNGREDALVLARRLH